MFSPLDFKFLKKSILFLVLGIFSLFSFAQEKQECQKKTTNKKAMKLFEKAKKEMNFNKCKELVEAATEEDPQFGEAYLFLAKRAKRLAEDAPPINRKGIEALQQATVEAYKKLIEVCPDYSPLPYFDLGTYYYYKEKYDEALPYLKKISTFEKAKDGQVAFADSLIKMAKLFKNKVPFNPIPVQGICSTKDEYLPIISPDNELAFYTRRYDKLSRGDYLPTSVEEFTFSTRDSSGIFDKGELMPYPFNMNNNEGGATVSVDNNHLFFTICRQEGIGKNRFINCDIYYADYKNGAWSEIKNMGPVVNDPKAWDSQPSVSSDGKTVYFASNRDSLNGSDIYKIVKDSAGKWTAPVKLGTAINTKGNEKSPFIHADSKTLYFSSDGRPGMGGFDIFFSKLDSSGNWGTAQNIGYPINSESDDIGFFVSTDGKTGYFASNKLKGKDSKGGWDVYSFDLYEKARPSKVLFVKGELKKDERDTNPPVANVILKNTKTNQVTNVDVDTATGKYVAVTNFDNDYILTVKRKEYAFESQYISLKDTLFCKPKTVDLSLEKVEVGKSFTLNNIYYETNSAELKGESVFVVKEFIDFLKENPRIKVQINGHTDNIGADNDNMALSTDRAFTVYDLCLQNGIAKTRLSFKGFGKDKPIATNDTDEGRAKNRRTEFLIVAK